MIDIQKAKQVFKTYVGKYNPEDPKVAMKIRHIIKTSEESKRIAQSLNLNEEDVKLAELIGLLHDIGRFEQIRVFNTFEDHKSINHGEYGVKVLFEDNLIKEFLEKQEYNDIIKKSVLNHNKSLSQIDYNELNERETLHTNIIRDADKADIFRVLLEESTIATYGKIDFSNEKITDNVYEDYIRTNGKEIDYSKKETSVDTLVCQFAYIQDLNYSETKKSIFEKKYIDMLYKKFEFKDEETKVRIEKVYNIARNTLEKEI